MILVEFADQVLAITDDEFEIARERGLKLMTSPRPQVDNEILDASGMEARTGVPASWFAENARKGNIPYLKFGKYIRFDLYKTLKAVKKR